ncbi:MAG: DUF1801 domain-containing protein [Bacteroidetes bacterium]|nr:DUF1801 domain-containing protein [Bacteroidota bacterium]
MAKNKTTETKSSVKDFISKVENETKRDDSYQIIKIMKEATGFEPKMWGPSIIGFGSYHYKYESGREGDMPVVAFSPRKPEIVLYLSLNEAQREKLLKKFGKHKTSKGCIYIKKLEDIDIAVLKEMVAVSVKNKT